MLREIRLSELDEVFPTLSGDDEKQDIDSPHSSFKEQTLKERVKYLLTHGTFNGA